MKSICLVLGIVLLAGMSSGILTAEEPTPFIEYTGNPIYGQHLGNEKAYYPAVLVQWNEYKMWVDNGTGTIAVTTSADGLNWSVPTLTQGLSTAYHPVVLFHADFGYKIYYWDGTVAGLSTRTADSADGILWQNDRAITQDPIQYLVGGAHKTWWYHHYGASQVFYNPGAANAGGHPWDYSYVMVFDTASEGRDTGIGIEHSGLAFSRDGDHWIRYGTEPILIADNSLGWDGDYAYHGHIVRIGNNWRMWYSGSDYEAGGDYYAQGIGEAFSNDGLTWNKCTAPVLHRDDGVPWRMKRSYTPWVIFQNGKYKMWFTGKSDSNYSIGYAETAGPPNKAPNKPKKPAGKAAGKLNKTFKYKFKTTDPDGDDLYYKIDWGNGTETDWEGPMKSGKRFKVNHKWETTGTFYIRVKAMDVNSAQSDWSALKKVKIK